MKDVASVALLAPPQVGGGDMFKKVSYIISSTLEKRHYPMEAVSKTASCNYHQHIPAALQVLNPFFLGQLLLTTLQRSGRRLQSFIAALLFI